MSWLPKKTVVVPVDFSESSVPAIRTGIECAESPDGVHVVHTILALEMASPYAYWAIEDQESRQSKATRHFDEFLRDHDLDGVRPVILMGDPGLRIVEYANKNKADLIVIPSHGYHGFKRFLLGSTAERVIRHAHCPVYVLRRTDAE